MEDKKLKTLKVKPQFYSVCLEGLQDIARNMGYNLIIHGSMNRDMDLVAIAWTDEPKTHLELIHSFSDYLGVEKFEDKEHYLYSILPGGRHSYVIQLNRKGKLIDDEWIDPEYYLDISFTPQINKISKMKELKENFIKLIEDADLLEGYDCFNKAFDSLPDCYAKGILISHFEKVMDGLSMCEEVREEILTGCDWDIWK